MFSAFSLGCCLLVSTSTINRLERLLSEMTCYVSSGTLNSTHPLISIVLLSSSVVIAVFLTVCLSVSSDTCAGWWDEKHVSWYCGCSHESQFFRKCEHWRWPLPRAAAIRTIKDGSCYEGNLNLFTAYFYNPQMQLIMGSVVSVCVCFVCALTFESLHLETSFLVCGYALRVSRLSLYIKVIGSRSQEQNSHTNITK